MNIEQIVKTLVEKMRSIVTEETGKLELKLTEKQHKTELALTEKIMSQRPVETKTVQNIDDIELNFNEETRSLTVVAKFSDREISKSIKLPTMIYRGVFCEDFTYEKGDCVTCSGSMWVCKAETTQVKPGSEGSQDWQLSVKRGRDGKDIKGE